ncbi:hypothetical protein [Streptomyces himalayensis]|uniref:Uncharacterized protein n=1 Tax=Streptomyces himalayensis subsp. himalayensis TaxID=2756131 RepID=A0A7W0IE28_9ACTN|nr:hypothetical protein [Streptomyces himalayensis]MBA2951932.1 hypothetical protein [Streptomyces himalayensis subsp. himalayensis]
MSRRHFAAPRREFDSTHGPATRLAMAWTAAHAAVHVVGIRDLPITAEALL